MDEVRGIVLPQDIELFDELILGMEVAAMGNKVSIKLSKLNNSLCINP